MNDPKPVLGQIDWIKAAFRALSTEGLKGVRVEALARTLKISKGSFYWHFKDQKDLKTKMLAHWKQVATLTPSDEVMSADISPRARLEQLVGFAAQGGSADYGGQLAELSVREWARVDEEAGACVREVDDIRLGVLVGCFVGCGLEQDMAQFRARLLYGALIGMEHLQSTDEVDMDVHLRHLLDALLKH